MKIFENIYKKAHKAVSMVLGIALCSMFAVSCVDDELEQDVTGGGNDVEVEGDCLAFTMQLDKALSTRGGDLFGTASYSTLEKYDNYIDTQDKFRVFFFNEDGDFLFGATDRIVGTLNDQDNATSDYYYVRIPMNVMVDREGQEYDVDKIKKYLKEHNFKIAVLANWPNGGEKINPADYDDGEFTGSFEENESSILKGNPRWNWSNSILNPQAKPSDIRNINDLHHVYKDEAYSASDRLPYYEQFMSDAKSGDEAGHYLGEPTDWVEMRDVEEGWKNPYALNSNARDKQGNKYEVSSIEGLASSFNSKETANQWIRANWTPNWDMNENKQIYRHYQHLWYLWNFDASYKYGAWLASNSRATDTEKKAKADEIYGDNFEFNDATTAHPVKWIVNPWGAEWYERNGDDIYAWMKPSMTVDNSGKVSYSNLGTLTTASTETAAGDKQNVMTFKPMNGAHMVQLGGLYGILLPSQPSSVDYADDNTTGCFRFRARTAGTIRVRWSSSDGNKAVLNIQKNVKTRSDASNQKYETKGTTPITTDWDVSVGDNAFPMYVYGKEGNVVIYSIEYIRGKYLYDTDRQGRMPNANQGIPMYGVQQYSKIPDWQRGTTHNLDGNIYLIRALAKIEVYISKSFGELQHVYMKSMNRAARCEPMNVETNTSYLFKTEHWYGENNADNCEWYRIQKYGACYDIPKDNYTKWLNWFYKDWEGRKWKTSGYTYSTTYGYWRPNNNAHTGWSKDLSTLDTYTNVDGETLKSPQLFNPYINRSDFCRFIYAGEDDSNYIFVLYMPDKNIDDPSTVGKMNSTPKVPHIEYRFAPDNPKYPNTEFNLDDNDCYRIYFTNYGQSTGGENLEGTQVNPAFSGKSYDKQRYDEYEKSRYNLSYHWPVMRNHRYQFYVGGTAPETPTIQVRVSDWSHQKVVVEW